jgi:group II intron reverse transcriptase/maturase
MEVVCLSENILLAYRNIKKNKGSNTPGTDHKTIKDMARLSETELVTYVRRRLHAYVPQPVRRKEIPKSDGGVRPLGIPTIADRLIQQCFLQVLEPICEAKFYERSNGFRPNRSCENALAQSYKLMQQSNLHYVVDIDIKGFFDTVNHAKLLKQMWSMGIHDKSLLSIVSKMLRAEVAGIGFPKMGTPQGGVISPLLSNIVLNELDWWIHSQWEGMVTEREYASQPGKYKTLRQFTALKECYIVRYADDFRIFCRNISDAKRIYQATEMWLKERLGLSVSADKSRIVNLRQNYSDFLGFKLKVRPKGKKHVVTSHVGDKALRRINDDGKRWVRSIQHSANTIEAVKNIRLYNSWVLGTQNYYRFATNIQDDLESVAFQIRKNFEIRLGQRLSKTCKIPMSKYLQERFKRTRQVRYCNENPILPVGAVSHKSPMFKPRIVNSYTPEGRAVIHKGLPVGLLNRLNALMRSSIPLRSVEYSDNRLSLFAGQLGKCAITGVMLEVGECEVHHITPVFMGGNDAYNNLIFVTTSIHKLLHATKAETISRYLDSINLNKEQTKRLDRYRGLINLDPIAN